MRSSDLYTMEELLPIVAGLTDMYTAGRSSSVTYEKARMLMRAVKYCIDELDYISDTDRHEDKSGNSLPAAGTAVYSAGEAYELGCELVHRRVKRAALAYKELLTGFRAYDCRNLSDTVIKGLKAFFDNYSVRFDPENTVITMDYPVMKSVGEQDGIRAVEEYLHCVILEQRFLNGFTESEVYYWLENALPDYRNMYENIAGIVLRCRLAAGIRAKQAEGKIPAEKGFKNAEREIYAEYDRLITESYGGDKELYDYLKSEVKAFCATVRIYYEEYETGNF